MEQRWSVHLQRPKVLRRQANRRGRSISRHIKPKLAQLSNSLCDPSADRRRNERISFLCRWRMYQNIHSEERHSLRYGRTKAHPPTKLKDHLSYGGRAMLRRCPFFMASNTWIPGGSSHEDRKDKQANTGLRPSFHCVCLLGRARSASRRAGNYR